MNNSYFYISEPEKKNQSNDELFSYYYHSIKWDVKMICGAGTSGYILQKVKILNTMPSIQLLFEPEVDIERNVVYKEYYEAWRVVDRKIIYSDSFDDRDDYDDIFLNKSKFFYLDDMLSESLGKEGIIAYTAEVYLCYDVETGKAVTIPESSRYQSLCVCGGSGSGKTSHVYEPLMARDLERKYFYKEVSKEMGFTAL